MKWKISTEKKIIYSTNLISDYYNVEGKCNYYILKVPGW